MNEKYEKWLLFALSFLLPGIMGATVALITVQVSLGYESRRFDDYKASQRYQEELRDKATTIQYAGILSRLDRIEARLYKETSLLLEPKYAFLVAEAPYVQPHHKALPPAPKTLIFEDKLAEIKRATQPLARKQREHEISDHEEDMLMEADQHTQLIRVWQAYCESDPDIREWCLEHQQELLPQ